MSVTLAATRSEALARFTASARRLTRPHRDLRTRLSGIRRQVADPAATSVLDEIVEVKTGLLGLGKRLYVPMSAVQEVLAESIFLSSPKEEFESRGYYEKPAHLSKVG